MAFQQPQARRKQTLHSPPRCTTPDAVQSPLATSDQDEEEGVLLFSLSDSQASWTLLASPRRARLSRLHSYGSSSQLTTSPGGSPLQIELDHSLLPSHDGTGAFAQASSLRGTSVGSTQGESEEGELIGRMRGRGRRESRTTQGTETDESVQGSELDGNSDQGRWELTEQALESLHSSNRLGLFHPRDQEQDEEGSAGFTSGSEEEEEDRGSESQRSRRKGKGRRTNEQEEEMEQSLSALSAGITPRARRQLASRSPSNRPPLLPIVGETSTSQRSLSPYYNISTLSQTSSDGFSVGSNGVRYKSKRRHRNAGSGSQSKRLLEMGKFERIEEEEAKRAERMKGVLEERIKENEIAGAKKEILMGDLASKLMSIDPSTYPLLAANDPTPTPSRAPSPPIFAQSVRRDLSSSTFDSIGDAFVDNLRALRDEEQEDEEDEGNLTETEGISSSPAINLTKSSRSESERNNWVHSSSPPVFAPRSPPSSFTSNPLHLSRSTPNNFSLPFSTHSHSLSLRPTNLSHEERLILSSSSTTEESAPWGELDSSFEVYMNYWKRFLRRFKRASSGGRETSEGSGGLRGMERDETGSERSRGEIY